MGMISEFKEFAMKGNVMDMAVGIIIGGAFGTIVKSLVEDVIMPPIGLLMGGVDFSALSIKLQEASPAVGEVLAPDGAVTTAAVKATEAVSLNYGNFINNVITFLIVAFAVFMMVKAMNSMQKEEEEAPAADPEPSAEEQRLIEIRDILAKK